MDLSRILLTQLWLPWGNMERTPSIKADSIARGAWGGRTDVLLRVEDPHRRSRFGGWFYEVVDCKLASETKAESILQLCLYSELLAELQGLEPEFFHVVRPNVNFEPESLTASASFAAYYRVVKGLAEGGGASQPIWRDLPGTGGPLRRLPMVEEVRSTAPGRRSPFPFVAGGSKLQRKELNVQGVETLEALATLPLPIPFRPAPRRHRRATPAFGSRHGFSMRRGMPRGELKYELLPLRSGETDSFAFPRPRTAISFSISKGDPFRGGRRESVGVPVRRSRYRRRGPLTYTCRWALDRAQ